MKISTLIASIALVCCMFAGISLTSCNRQATEGAPVDSTQVDSTVDSVAMPQDSVSIADSIVPVDGAESEECCD